MAIHEPEWSDMPMLWQPKRLEEAVELKRVLGEDAVFVAGGTLLQTEWENDRQMAPLHMISIEGIDRLKGVYEKINGDQGHLVIGPLTSLTTCMQHPLIKNSLLARACKQIAAPSVRNRGTIGGNVLSINGDALPAMLVMNAELIWQHGKKHDRTPLREWLQSRRRNSTEREDRLLVSIQLEDPRETEYSFSYYEKVGRREAFAPSLVTVAASGLLDNEGRFVKVTLAVGGGKAIPDRLPVVESMLTGMKPDVESWQQIHEYIRREYQAGHDSFASSAYRKQAAANLLLTGLMSEQRKLSSH
ncbi:FAD binding domain-containing protein [Paenibacillus sp. GP183]|uniref:FAD binding domain-containing protein n=1 Tax=Paenibacillus sp. GP183 TaxID=1882751 RepID=UPI00089BBDF4|nr:FAD binding domain-containing protein [Paenibacillus sp. GP183]SEB55954.1 carbon-monoxide dehydrogenase medium subunit [Paenibacillus sp. GP183]